MVRAYRLVRLWVFPEGSGRPLLAARLGAVRLLPSVSGDSQAFCQAMKEDSEVVRFVWFLFGFWWGVAGAPGVAAPGRSRGRRGAGGRREWQRGLPPGLGEGQGARFFGAALLA